MGDSGIPNLSVPAFHELRRIHSKRLLEVFPSPETCELYDRGCISGRFATSPRTFIIERVTDLGLAALQRREQMSVR